MDDSGKRLGTRQVYTPSVSYRVCVCEGEGSYVSFIDYHVSVYRRRDTGSYLPLADVMKPRLEQRANGSVLINKGSAIYFGDPVYISRWDAECFSRYLRQSNERFRPTGDRKRAAICEELDLNGGEGAIAISCCADLHRCTGAS